LKNVNQFMNKEILNSNERLIKCSLEQMVKVINDELNQKYLNPSTLIGFYIANELFFEILQGFNY
jgi:hypothetical protein